MQAAVGAPMLGAGTRGTYTGVKFGSPDIRQILTRETGARRSTRQGGPPRTGPAIS